MDVRETDPPTTGPAPVPVGLRGARESARRRTGAAAGDTALTTAVPRLRHGRTAPVPESSAARRGQRPRHALVALAPDTGDGHGARARAGTLLDVSAPPESPAAAARPGAPAADRAGRTRAMPLSAPTPRHPAAGARRPLTRPDEAGPALARLTVLRRGGHAERCTARWLPGVPADRSAPEAGDGRRATAPALPSSVSLRRRRGEGEREG
ncbi:hypothetical protein C1708_00145 [Streptomyces sp. DH-12]|uniref:hypothetical protein n=1 Tax=Streptomyces sp. DH-12 TaxID=2072509 RepID=UPI000CCE89CA|nr:hypothetical protein [Streptomyces sp. DH-12]PNV30972.1 hypothetical protein C1708_00145 [Streptomyces sp. DH-12]